MSKAVVIEIDKCEDCEWVSFSHPPGHGWQCSIMTQDGDEIHLKHVNDLPDGNKPIENIDLIPEWCPLDDWAESKAKNHTESP